MTDTLFFPNTATIEELFKNGTCLTYYPADNPEYLNARSKLRSSYFKENRNTNFQILSQRAKLAMPPFSKFHYFSNGALVHSFAPEDTKAIERIKTMLSIRNLPLNEIHGPEDENMVST